MRGKQLGITLPVTLLLLLAALALGASAAQMAMLGEKAARSERDRLIAFQAAEDAMTDAERDINAGLGEVPAPGAAPAWQAIDLAGNESTEYGALTGATMETGQGSQPFRRPRYLVERIAYTPDGAAAGTPPAHYYRVTVIGFGSRPGAETVLQATYQPPAPVRRYSWREILDRQGKDGQ